MERTVPDDEVWDAFVSMGSHQLGGDYGGDVGIFSRGSPRRIPCTRASRVRPDIPHKRWRPTMLDCTSGATRASSRANSSSRRKWK
jgi:hypothetical protein